MTLNDKIRNFISSRGLTSTKFADEIDVPRPSISHILSGRNKPSLEIVQKMYKTYPELGFEWFFEDEEFEVKNDVQISHNQPIMPSKRVGYVQRDLNEKKVHESSSAKSNVESHSFAASLGLLDTSHQVERIVVFYTNKTFTEFKPNY
jgi:transcriptional regulator with XRE-family HTH domain